MPEHVAWRASWHRWLLLGLAALLLTHRVSPHLLDGAHLALTLLLVAGGLLAAYRLWRLPPAISLCIAIVLTIFSGGWSQIGLAGLPLDRFFTFLALATVLLRAPGATQTPHLDVKPIHLLLGVTALYVTASAIASGTLLTSVGGLSLLDQVGVVPYLMFLVAPAVFAGERERELLLITLVGLGAYLGFTAVFESLGPHSLVFPSYIVGVDAALPEARAGGPFQSSVAEGFATFSCAVAALIAFSRWHGHRRRYLALTVAVVCAFGCFLTLERGVWLAAIIATLITTLTTHTGRRLLVPGACACALIVAGALTLSPALASKVSQRVSYSRSVWDRQNQSAAALRMIQARPLFGFGWDRYGTDSVDYFRQANSYPLTGYSVNGRVQLLHNTYLSYAVELGLVGTLLWLASLLLGLGAALFSRAAPELRLWKLGLLAISIFFCVVSFFNPYMLAFPALLLWAWAGLAMAPPIASRNSPSYALSPQRLDRADRRVLA